MFEWLADKATLISAFTSKLPVSLRMRASAIAVSQQTSLTHAPRKGRRARYGIVVKIVPKTATEGERYE